MFRLVRLLLACLLLLLVGCFQLPQGEAAAHPVSESSMGLSGYFSDPQAQQLALAAEQGRVEDVRRLMKQEGVNPDVHFSQEGMPLLAWPVLTGSSAGLQAMLDNGADPNARKLHPAQNTERFKGRYENNAMVFAAKKDDPIYLQILLDHGGDPNTRSSNNENLMYVARLHATPSWSNVKLLVERGADTNVVAGMGSTILGDYAMFGGFENVYWLLEHGADPMAKANLNVMMPSPHSEIIDSIYWYPSPTPAGIEWQRKCQQWLLQNGHPRPPMSNYLRKKRQDFNLPTNEEDIPLL